MTKEEVAAEELQQRPAVRDVLLDHRDLQEAFDPRDDQRELCGFEHLETQQLLVHAQPQSHPAHNDVQVPYLIPCKELLPFELLLEQPHALFE